MIGNTEGCVDARAIAVTTVSTLSCLPGWVQRYQDSLVDNVDARKWTKCLDTASQQQPLPPRGLGQDRHGGDSSNLTISSNDVSDLNELKVDQGRFSPSTELFQDSTSLLVTVLLHEPSWGFLEKPDSSGENQSRNTLEGKREAPWEAKSVSYCNIMACSWLLLMTHKRTASC